MTIENLGFGIAQEWNEALIPSVEGVNLAEALEALRERRLPTVSHAQIVDKGYENPFPAIVLSNGQEIKWREFFGIKTGNEPLTINWNKWVDAWDVSYEGKYIISFAQDCKENIPEILWNLREK